MGRGEGCAITSCRNFPEKQKEEAGLSGRSTSRCSHQHFRGGKRHTQRYHVSPAHLATGARFYLRDMVVLSIHILLSKFLFHFCLFISLYLLFYFLFSMVYFIDLLHGLLEYTLVGHAYSKVGHVSTIQTICRFLYRFLSTF